jgi:lysophospholipase L1-like esterase
VSAGASPGCGLVALGDSITNGHGEPMLGVHAQSWALWLAQAMDVPFHGLASDGARVADVLREQVPRAVGGARRYELGCVFAGVNDARSADWSADAFGRDFRAVAEAVGGVSDVLLLVTLPVDLGRPTSAPKPVAANAVVRTVASRTGAVVCELSDVRGGRAMLPDAVHPTALGQVVIAERAARALRAAGVDVRRSPRELADPDRSPRARARWRARSSWLWLGDVRRRLAER